MDRVGKADTRKGTPSSEAKGHAQRLQGSLDGTCGSRLGGSLRTCTLELAQNGPEGFKTEMRLAWCLTFVGMQRLDWDKTSA